MFYLPKLKRVSIYDYPLYKCPLIMDFNKKLNIIYGTNGTGKTTLLMIILFSIIGPYKNYVKTRLYKEQRKDSRTIYDSDFFLERATNFSATIHANVISEFEINHDYYVVEHSLNDCSLLSVSINGNKLSGEIIQYKTFEQKYQKYVKDKSENYLDGYLIKRYHDKLKKSTQLPGDDINTLISMFVDIMFFDERRRYSFWNADLQDLIIGKYIVDSETYEEYFKLKLDTKSLESVYKKKSETLNYYKKLIKKESVQRSKIVENAEIQNVEEIELKIKELEDDIQFYKQEVAQLQLQQSKNNNVLVRYYEEREKIKERINLLEDEWYSNIFPSPYKHYYEKFSGSMMKGVCPVCKQNHDFDIKTDKCIFCGESFSKKNDVDVFNLDLQLKDCQNELLKLSSGIGIINSDIEKIKLQISKDNSDILKLITRKNQLDSLLLAQDENFSSVDSERIRKMEEDRDNAIKQYKKSKDQECNIKNRIAESLADNFAHFRSSFNQYAGSFFGEKHKEDISMPFEDFEMHEEDSEIKDDFLIRFTLDGKKRDSDDMLSESQRIFTDFAFRFAILTAYHDNAFFMCETPDSTLDSFHEKQAIKTFLNFLNNGYSLILSANFRKGELISSLYKEYGEENVQIIDLTQKSNISLGPDYTFDKNI